MVQVDVFWSYAIGSSFALGASHQLAARAKRSLETAAAPAAAEPAPRWQRVLGNPYLIVATLFLALLFAPSGAYLLWEFPSWETMHAGDRDLPAWLVALFASTNTLLGVGGFLVTQWLIAGRHTFAAYLQAAGAYFGMFFILVHGWDGEGYRRFFSPTEADYRAWDGDWSAFLTSDVAITLYVMGVFLLPPMLVTIARWLVEGWRLSGARARIPRGLLIASIVAGVAGIPLAAAVGTSLLIHALGVAPGVAIALAALWLLGLRQGSPGRRLLTLFALAGDPGAEPRDRAGGRLSTA